MGDRLVKLLRQGKAVEWHKCSLGDLCITEAIRTRQPELGGELGWRVLVGPWHWCRSS